MIVQFGVTFRSHVTSSSLKHKYRKFLRESSYFETMPNLRSTCQKISKVHFTYWELKFWRTSSNLKIFCLLELTRSDLRIVNKSEPHFSMSKIGRGSTKFQLSVSKMNSSKNETFWLSKSQFYEFWPHENSITCRGFDLDDPYLARSILTAVFDPWGISNADLVSSLLILNVSFYRVKEFF